MDSGTLYSIRMHASKALHHVSGAERIVPANRMEEVVHALIARANRKASNPEKIVITIECLQDLPVLSMTALDVLTVNSCNMISGRSAASALLQGLGISKMAIHTAMNCLAKGPAASGGNMRGAMIIDAANGERLESDQERGVRATRFDWTDEAFGEIDRILSEAGLTHHRTREALALATKVAHAPGVLAELCWSDDPEYIAGYVASLRSGYVRFPVLKPEQDSHGGRAIFVNSMSLDRDGLTEYLQQKTVLITSVGAYRGSIDPARIMECIEVNRPG